MIGNLLQPAPEWSEQFKRWYPLRKHVGQDAVMASRARFITLPCGRRSGKTECAKRDGVSRGIAMPADTTGRIVFGAPVHQQAKDIWWADLKKMVPRHLLRQRISESELVIPLWNGVDLKVAGLDRPERLEGSPLLQFYGDEWGNCKGEMWGENIRPALADTNGGAWLLGVPEGRNHYYEKWEYAISGEDPEWAGFTWWSETVLPLHEIEQMRRDMDDLTFSQECRAEWINFTGRCYYPFQEAIHCEPVRYNPRLPLIFCFDFNVEPGVAVVLQEQPYGAHSIVRTGATPTGTYRVADSVTAIVGEVWIPRHSNTPAVCRKLLADWGNHAGDVLLYGDATGGARGSAKIAGSDWDLIRKELKPVYGPRLKMRVPDDNPKERVRINAVNSRLMAADGTVRLLVNKAKAPHVVKDLEGVTLLEGGSGEIDKDADEMLTHISDALGYYIVKRWPVVDQHRMTLEAV